MKLNLGQGSSYSNNSLGFEFSDVEQILDCVMRDGVQRFVKPNYELRDNSNIKIKKCALAFRIKIRAKNRDTYTLVRRQTYELLLPIVFRAIKT